jgi:hypothetical protein
MRATTAFVTKQPQQVHRALDHQCNIEISRTIRANYIGLTRKTKTGPGCISTRRVAATILDQFHM